MEGNFACARELHYKMLPLMTANFVESNPIPVKAALEMLGLPAGVPRLPLVAATASNG